MRDDLLKRKKDLYKILVQNNMQGKFDIVFFRYFLFFLDKRKINLFFWLKLAFFKKKNYIYIY